MFVGKLVGPICSQCWLARLILPPLPPPLPRAPFQRAPCKCAIPLQTPNTPHAHPRLKLHPPLSPMQAVL